MVKRWIAGFLAVFAALNGASMLIDGPRWYASVPGVINTGPYNPHFVADIGVAFLAAAIGLAMRAWREAFWPAAVSAAAFLAFHAIIHVIGLIGGHSHHPGFEWAVVVVPSAIAAWAATPGKWPGRA